MYGKGIPANLTGGGPAPTGAMKANLTGEVLVSGNLILGTLFRILNFCSSR